MNRRFVEWVVISDVHLGTLGCHAEELGDYLDSIEPGGLILNGDIIDIWQFRKRYFPPSHWRVLSRILEWMQMGVPVYYLTGNHDELLRKLSGLRLSNLHLQNKLVLELDGKQAWFFHGDIFDVTVQHSKWIARLGGWGYDALIGINRVVNLGLVRMGRERISISKRVKDGVKQAVKFIRDFEQIAADLAIENGFDYVVCGHIHQPQIRRVYSENGSVVYLNSGDWVENLTALEYHEGMWRLYDHLSEWVAKEVTKENTILQGNPAVDFH